MVVLCVQPSLDQFFDSKQRNWIQALQFSSYMPSNTRVKLFNGLWRKYFAVHLSIIISLTVQPTVDVLDKTTLLQFLGLLFLSPKQHFISLCKTHYKM